MKTSGELKRLFIVTSCYNEESALPITAPKFVSTMRLLVESRKISTTSSVIVVDDGSDDGTAAFLARFSAENPEVTILTLSENHGQQYALVSGMRLARRSGADAVLTMDCDGQDDFCVVEKFLDAYLGGDDVVYGVRGDRSSDGVLYRTLALTFYRIMKVIGSKVVFNHAEFRLMSAQVVDAVLAGWREGVFLRGYVPTLGFRSSYVVYRRESRCAGVSHYTWWKLFKLALGAMFHH